MFSRESHLLLHTLETGTGSQAVVLAGHAEARNALLQLDFFGHSAVSNHGHGIHGRFNRDNVAGLDQLGIQDGLLADVHSDFSGRALIHGHVFKVTPAALLQFSPAYRSYSIANAESVLTRKHALEEELVMGVGEGGAELDGAVVEVHGHSVFIEHLVRRASEEYLHRTSDGLGNWGKNQVIEDVLVDQFDALQFGEGQSRNGLSGDHRLDLEVIHARE